MTTSPPSSPGTAADGQDLDAALVAVDALRDAGNLRGAVDLLRRLLGRHPEVARLHSLLGYYLRDLGHHAEALDACRTGLALDPGSDRAHRLLGYALAARPRTRRQALVHLKEAVRLAPETALNHYHLALVHTRLIQPRQARQCFAKACELAPDDPGLAAGAAGCLLTLNRAGEARAFAARAFALGPDNPHALAVEARARLHEGLSAEARDLAAAALAIDAGNATATAVLIEADMCRSLPLRLWSRGRGWTAGRPRRAALAVFAAYVALSASLGVVAAAAPAVPPEWGAAAVLAAGFLCIVLLFGPTHVLNRRLAAARRPVAFAKHF